MATLLAAIEATLLGKDERLVAKCNVPGILAVFERWDIYDVDTLSRGVNRCFPFVFTSQDLDLPHQTHPQSPIHTSLARLLTM